ncbi:MAG: hypothetical protein ACK41T_00910 [Pseudobdellovibrio sp.]
MEVIKHNFKSISTVVLVLGVLLQIQVSEAARIRMRKVKEYPKVCEVMEEDKFLSRSDRRIYSTLRNSVIFDSDVSLVNDLGKKICLWSYDKWIPLGDLSKYKYYIDEPKNILYSYAQLDNQYHVARISLDDCTISEVEITDKLELPKCEKKKSNRKSVKRKVANQSKKATSSQKSKKK